MFFSTKVIKAMLGWFSVTQVGSFGKLKSNGREHIKGEDVFFKTQISISI